jgi:hypothetical protein
MQYLPKVTETEDGDSMFFQNVGTCNKSTSVTTQKNNNIQVVQFQKWKVTRHDKIPINRNINIDAMLFADDQVLLAKSEDDLQYSVNNLNKIAPEISMDINMEKTRVMAFRGMEPIRRNTLI